jgi:hypothetical protein
MQIMFALTFILMLVASMTSLATRTNENLASTSDSVAWQMTAWHRAAVDLCARTTCPGGMVDPFEYLNEGLKNGQAFRNGSFISVHEPTTRQVVTFLSGSYQRSGLGYASISGALSQTLTGPSNDIGTYDGSVIVPFRPFWMVHSPNDPDTTPHPIALSSPFAGRTIPVGSPVILSRLCEFMPVNICG